jgi:hypothetical protein
MVTILNRNVELNILFEEQMKYNIVEKRNTFSRCQGD